MTTEIERDLGLLAEKLRRSTVAVRSARNLGSGTGVVWSADGTIVTNAHVAMTRTLDIRLGDGRRFFGTVERRDDRRDLASIRIEADGLEPAEIRDPAGLRAGELLVAFGHPNGVPNVLSTGIAYQDHGTGERRFVRSDVRLGPGNSGGPLADVAGRVVGINSMVVRGQALSIPSDAVQRFLGIAAAPARLGVRLAPALLASGRIAYAVLDVEADSTAERSGLRLGDVILAPSAGALGGATHLDILRAGTVSRLKLDRGDAGHAAA
jgi:serine protease Do